jgi:hypothetical protein
LLGALLLPLQAWSAVQLSWEYTQNPLALATHFAVYRDDACTGAPVVLGTVAYTGQGTPTFTDASAVPLTTYCYFVTARDAQGGESDASNVVTFYLQEETPHIPFPPFGLHGTVIP